jgi:hypothetical protein
MRPECEEKEQASPNDICELQIFRQAEISNQWRQQVYNPLNTILVVVVSNHPSTMYYSVVTRTERTGTLCKTESCKLTTLSWSLTTMPRCNTFSTGYTQRQKDRVRRLQSQSFILIQWVASALRPPGWRRSPSRSHSISIRRGPCIGLSRAGVAHPETRYGGRSHRRCHG